ncbi:MAG: hypothetical protein PV345_03730 [Wolbachia sp.]|nr:hypothetical protein [Wolbachia sp.]
MITDNQNEKSIFGRAKDTVSTGINKLGERVDNLGAITTRLPWALVKSIIYPMRPSSWSRSWRKDFKEGVSDVVGKPHEGSTLDRVGVGIARLIKAPLKIATYSINPSSWFRSDLGHLWHDIKNGGRHIIGKQHVEEYNLPIDTTIASKNLGIEIIGYENGKVTLLVSRAFIGDVPYVSNEHLKKVEESNKESRYSKITVNRERNSVAIEIDVKEIIAKIKADPKNKGKSEEEIKGIAKEVDSSMKGFAEITGGESKKHEDLKLLKGIAEKLYKEYNIREQQSKTETMSKNTKRPTEVLKKAASNGASENLRLISKQSSEILTPKESSEATRAVNGEKPSKTIKVLVDDDQLKKFESKKSFAGDNTPSQTVRVLVDNEQLQDFNMTNPKLFPFNNGKSNVTIRSCEENKLSMEDLAEQARKIGNNGFKGVTLQEVHDYNNGSKDPLSAPQSSQAKQGVTR